MKKIIPQKPQVTGISWKSFREMKGIREQEGWRPSWAREGKSDRVVRAEREHWPGFCSGKQPSNPQENPWIHSQGLLQPARSKQK